MLGAITAACPQTCVATLTLECRVHCQVMGQGNSFRVQGIQSAGYTECRVYRVQGIQTEGIQTEGIQTEGIQTEGMQTLGMQTLGMQLWVCRLWVCRLWVWPYYTAGCTRAQSQMRLLAKSLAVNKCTGKKQQTRTEAWQASLLLALIYLCSYTYLAECIVLVMGQGNSFTFCLGTEVLSHSAGGVGTYMYICGTYHS